MKFYLAIVCVFTGCVSEVEIPKDVMSKNQMISFVIDVHILEAQTGQLRISKDSARVVFQYFEDELLQKHKVNDSLYYRSLEFYYAHPLLMEEVYAAVLDSLSLYERMSKGNLETEGSDQRN
ncbi:MAG TPA: DUF4296 domain-containing protein [Cyclobacteriaceae bacterium]